MSSWMDIPGFENDFFEHFFDIFALLLFHSVLFFPLLFLFFSLGIFAIDFLQILCSIALFFGKGIVDCFVTPYICRYPYINITRKGSQYELSQSRFLIVPPENMESYDQSSNVWWIPIDIKMSNGGTRLVEMNVC